MNEQSINQLQQQKALQDAIQNLATSTQPSRDLWPEIERQLSAKPHNLTHNNAKQKVSTAIGYSNRRWIGWSIAATLLLSFTSIFISWNHWQNAQQLVAEQRSQTHLAAIEDIQLQMKSMEQDYGLAKSALLAQIGINTSQAGNELLSDVQANLMIIEQATSEIKSAIEKQPENPNLPKLLQATYQQELAVLRQLAQLDFGV